MLSRELWDALFEVVDIYNRDHRKVIQNTYDEWTATLRFMVGHQVTGMDVYNDRVARSFYRRIDKDDLLAEAFRDFPEYCHEALWLFAQMTFVPYERLTDYSMDSGDFGITRVMDVLPHSRYDPRVPTTIAADTLME